MSKMGRIDFIITPTTINEGRVEFVIEPNPARYKQIKKENENFYLDCHTSTLIPEKMMIEALHHAGDNFGKESTHYLAPSIKEIHPYSEKRKQAVAMHLDTGEYHPPAEQAKAHSEPDKNTPEKNIAFLSIDICDSTALRKRDPDSFDRVINIFFHELGTLVGQHNGTVLKFTGDGFIAYIDYPAFTLQTDTSAMLALAILHHLNSCINPILFDKGLDTIAIRIGMEFGLAKVNHIRIPATGKSQYDYSSDALNYAVKIQESCLPNEIRVGQDLRDLLNDSYLQRLHEIDFHHEVLIKGYRIYRFA